MALSFSGLEDEIETLNIAVPGPVVLPIELTQVFVALELADDPIVMERYIHPATDIAPARDLLRRQAKPRREFGATHVGKQVEHLQRPAKHPHSHDVGIGVVVEAGRCRIRIAVVKLVGTHHAADLVASAIVIEARDARPEAGDIEDQLRTVGMQKLDIAGDLEVLPDVMGDGTAYVALQDRSYRAPSAASAGSG